MKFKKIVSLDALHLSENAAESLQDYAEAPVKLYDTDPKDATESLERIKDADCVLVSWRAELDESMLSQCPNLKYIGICGTNADGIDVEACKERHIALSNIRDYGDEGVVEWIILQLLNIVRGTGTYQWREQRSELAGKTLGIIGLGAVGKLLAQAALGLGMRVMYFSRTRNHDWEQKGLTYAETDRLVQEADFISLHTPNNVIALYNQDFDLMTGKVLINTTLGKAFSEEALKNWIAEPRNYFIYDTCSDYKDAFKALDRVIYDPIVCGRTEESIGRLTHIAVSKVQNYLEQVKS